MTYVLGAVSRPLKLQFTFAKDDLASLGKAYGVEPVVIWEMQGTRKPMQRKPVQDFVKGLPGWTRGTGLYPFDQKENPGTNGPDGKPEGYAHFTANTKLLLPDMERTDGKKQPITAPPAPPSDTLPTKPPSKGDEVSETAIGGGLLLVGFAVVTALIVFELSNKKTR